MNHSRMFGVKKSLNLLMLLSCIHQLHGSGAIKIKELLDRKPSCDVKIIVRNHFEIIDVEQLMSGRASQITTALSKEVGYLPCIFELLYLLIELMYLR